MKALQDAGCDITRGRGGHFRVHQGPRLITSIAATAGDHRSYLNTRAQIRRQGIKI